MIAARPTATPQTGFAFCGKLPFRRQGGAGGFGVAFYGSLMDFDKPTTGIASVGEREA